LAEIERVSKGGYVSRWVEYRAHPHDGDSIAGPPVKPFILRPDVRIYLFSTEAPCGDASMGLLVESTVQAHGDATAWPEPESSSISTSDPPPKAELDTSTYPPTPPPLHGRGYFSLLGLVRRKPSRADAEPTLSKSCTDKLTLKQVTSVLAWPVSLFVQRTENVYLKSLVLPVEMYEELGFDRAFGRLGGGERDGMEGRAGLAVKRFGVLTFPGESSGANLVFPFSKPSSTSTPTTSPPSKASNLSALWVAGPNDGNSLLNETLVNGVKQGAKQWGGQEFKMSGVCRRRMWEVGRRVEDLLRQRDDIGENGTHMALLDRGTYDEAKQGILDADRKSAKQDAVRVLGGWARNEGDGAWGLN
jgi:tRNA-specific adenosine deaminase 1